MVGLVHTSCGCIWVLLHVTGDNQNQQTLEQPPATHLAKPLLIVLTAVEARDGFPRINKTLGNKVVSQSHAWIWLVCSCLDHVTWAKRTPVSKERALHTYQWPTIKSMPHWNNLLPEMFRKMKRMNPLIYWSWNWKAVTSQVAAVKVKLRMRSWEGAAECNTENTKSFSHNHIFSSSKNKT